VSSVVVDLHVPIYKHKDPEYNNISFHSLHKIMQGVLRFTNLAKPNSIRQSMPLAAPHQNLNYKLLDRFAG
jgi:hypothetical protein